jgi:UDP-N-acetylglucosamine--N-acetylmuramyl-(pentapeptide) pyrophosphoryl-undecaprenol N-acetylglucosamine transferase
MEMTVLFAAGGTGGHLYPAFAIAESLRKRGDDVVFVGTKERIEARLVPHAGFFFIPISAHPLRRRLSLDLLRTVWKNVAGFFQSLRLLDRVRPQAIVATGGYVCVPVVLAARFYRRLMRKPLIIALLEPNRVPGLANRLLAPRVDEVWTAAGTGVPIRASLANLPQRSAAIARFALDESKKTLLAFGGSQGARSINDAVISLVRERRIPEGWQVLLVTGESDYARVCREVRGIAVWPYLDDPALAYAAADLVLARSGASTLAELSALALPAILIPYPYATEVHQLANATAFAEGGAALVIEDAKLASALPQALAEIARPERLEALRAAARAGSRRDATGAIVARIDALWERTVRT